MKPIRLDRLLSSRGYCTRSQARDFLKLHELLADGERQLKPDAKVDADSVTIDNEPIDVERVLIMLHKPLGVTCSHKEEGPLIYDLLPERWRRRNPAVSTVGRLDKETSGLILLTDDGLVLHRLSSPKKKLPKIYLVELQHALRGDEAATFASGTMTLEDDDKPLLPAELEVIDSTHARLTIYEGRYHQVRRMFAAVGNHVLTLHRERIGKLALGDLPAGEFKAIEESDVID